MEAPQFSSIGQYLPWIGLFIGIGAIIAVGAVVLNNYYNSGIVTDNIVADSLSAKFSLSNNIVPNTETVTNASNSGIVYTRGVNYTMSYDNINHGSLTWLTNYTLNDTNTTSSSSGTSITIFFGSREAFLR